MFDLSGLQDAALVRRALAGQPEMFGRLVEKHLPLVHAVVRGQLGLSSEVDDIAQEAFLQAYLSLNQLQEPQRFRFWLATIARNRCHLHHKTGARRDQVHEALLGESPRTTSQEQEKYELHAMLKRALEDLEPEHREMLLLYYFSGRSLREIEATLNISREAAKKRLQRARAALGERLEGDLGELAQMYRPHKAQMARVSGAVLLAAPEWAPSLSAAGLPARLLDYAVTAMPAKAQALAVVSAITIAATSTVYMLTRETSASAQTALSSMDFAPPPQEITMASNVPPATPPPEEAPEPPTIAPEPETSSNDVAPAPLSKSLVASGRSLLAGGNAQRTGYYAVSAPITKPQRRWSTPMGQQDHLPGTMVALDKAGRLFSSYGKRGDSFFGAFSSTGETLWEYGPMDAGRSLSTPAVLASGAVVQQFRDGGLSVFDPASGELLWMYAMDILSSASPLIDRHDNLYVRAYNDNSLIKFAGNTGQVIWGHPQKDARGCRYAISPSLSLDESTVYCASPLGSRDTVGGLYAVKAVDGTLLWNFAPAPPAFSRLINWTSPIVGAGGTLYLQDTFTGHLFAVADRATHAETLWSYDPQWSGAVPRAEGRTGGATFNDAPLHVYDAPRFVATDGEAIYMGVFGYPATVHAVNADGSTRWITPLEGDALVGTPSVTASAVYIVGGGDDEVPGNNALYCLDRETGQILWQEPVAAAHGDTGESVAFGPDGTIYLASSGLDGQAVITAYR